MATTAPFLNYHRYRSTTELHSLALILQLCAFSLAEQLIEGGVYTIVFATGTLGTMKKEMNCVKLEHEAYQKALAEDVSLTVIAFVS